MSNSTQRSLSPGVVGTAVLVLALALGAAAWFAFDAGFRSGASPAATSEPQDEFERRVRAYLLENPEVILEAIERLEVRQQEAQRGAVGAVIAARSEELLNDPDSPVGGNPEGDVTLVYFFDYNCPYCRRAAPMLDEALQADSSLRMVFKEFPVLGPSSEFAARVALAAHRQGAYEVLHDAMMTHSGAINETSTLEIARELGLDVEQLKRDADDPAIAEKIANNLALARELRISGTPGFVIGEQVVRGLVDLSTLQQVVEHARSQER